MLAGPRLGRRGATGHTGYVKDTCHLRISADPVFIDLCIWNARQTWTRPPPAIWAFSAPKGSCQELPSSMTLSYVTLCLASTRVLATSEPRCFTNNPSALEHSSGPTRVTKVKGTRSLGAESQGGGRGLQVRRPQPGPRGRCHGPPSSLGSW